MSRLRRREFIGLVGASMASTRALAIGQKGSVPENVEVLEKNGWQVRIAPTGEIVSFTDGKLELVKQGLGSNRPRVVVGGLRVYACRQPKNTRREGFKVFFEYPFSDHETFSVRYEIGLVDLLHDSVALQQRVEIQSPGNIRENVKLELPRNFLLPFENRRVFLPLKNGIGRRKPILGLESEDEYVYSFAGGYDAMGKPQLLAIPMVDESADQTDLHLTFCTDPLFTSYVYLPARDKIGQLNCVYPGNVGLRGSEERTISTALHRGTEKKAMEVFYAAVLPDVKPGPNWLHDIAMVDYDYFSENGRGWFADINELTRLISPADRHKVFLALHGWYGYIGRYAFNPRTRSFERQWVALPNALDPRVQALGDAPSNGTGYQWKRPAVKAMRPVPMSIADMHHRIRYAKQRGFQVGIYYADGTNACEGLKDIFDPQKVLHWGGWVGPDTKGRTYAQNPLHPGVRTFYLDYIQALLEEYGKEVDGFIWDETYVVGSKELGPVPYSGYASRAMMTLVKQVAAKVADFSPRLAFLASDDIGAWYRYDQSAPYCLGAHGTYQDSWCSPVAWPYGLFPNYRNVLWSCNWAPVTRFVYTRYGAETYGVAVAISNGAFGDDIGISEMTSNWQERIMALFNERKRRRMEIEWVDEGMWNPTYDGKRVEFKWNL
jgi:hypothetical protein